MSADGIKITAVILTILSFIFAGLMIEQRYVASEKRTLFSGCVLAGGRPELCLMALQGQGRECNGN